jgi:hypothetical protein
MIDDERRCQLFFLINLINVIIQRRSIIIPSITWSMKSFTGVHLVYYPPCTQLLAWIRKIIHLFVVFDFHHAELVLPSSIIIVKPITIEEDYFKFLIPGKTKMKDFVNDPIIVSFMSFSIDCPRHNSTISSCCKRTKSFECG